MADDIDQLLAAMEAEARTEADAARAQACEHARQIQQEADDQIARLRQKAKEQADREARQVANRAEAAVSQAHRDAMRALRHELVADAFAQARQELLDRCQNGGHHDAMPLLLREAVAVLGTDVHVRAAEQDKAACADAAAELGLAHPLESEGDRPGVLVATSSDGRRRVDNGLWTRLDRAERLLRGAVAALLFREPPA